MIIKIEKVRIFTSFTRLLLVLNLEVVASKLYWVNATIIIFVYVLYCIVLNHSLTTFAFFEYI